MAERSVVLATAGFDHTIRLWEAPTGQCRRVLQFNDSQINCLAITPDKQLLAAGGNPRVRLYEVNGSNPNPKYSYEGHTGNVTSVGFQKDQKWMYTGSEDGSIKIWDIRTKGHQRNYYNTNKNKPGVNALALHPNQGEIISGDEDGNIRVWDLTTNSTQPKIQLVPDGKSAIRSITVASDASLVLAANNNGAVFAWKLGKGTFEAFHKIDAHNSYALKCLLSRDVKFLATTSNDKTVKIWNVDQNFKLHKTLKGHQAWVWDCSFSADSAYLVTASSDKTAKLWDLRTGDVILNYRAHHKAITSVALNDSST